MDLLPCQHLVDVQQRWRGVFVEQPVQLAVTAGIELEVVRSRWLTLGQQRDEVILTHRLKRVVRPALLGQRGASLGGELTTTDDPAP